MSSDSIYQINSIISVNGGYEKGGYEYYINKCVTGFDREAARRAIEREVKKHSKETGNHEEISEFMIHYVGEARK